MRFEAPGHTLQSTALIHEAYMKLIQQRDVTRRSRTHFFGIAAQMIRRILVDRIRAASAMKEDLIAVQKELTAPSTSSH